ncbi:hypothetical protein RAE19_12645 [Rhodoferax sp. TBRC 17660]|uniref:Uncharacterized protein n=1 Tax=Rhodoferax potami TaxID=3068338 RepID=A0ABU3KQ51_9BURK|nr:hypothetical protein [Rhodoferax sp. TBRC 17660]MDT7519547.1 hypothetical protein [Rhodoferax sp. TBRC 17660]
MCERSFRRYSASYEDSEGDLNSLADRRLSQASKRKAANTEIDELISLYQRRFIGWNVKHFFNHYARHQESTGQSARSYTWVKSALQGAGLVPKVAGRGKHHKKRDPKPLVGMMIHQDSSTHAWVPSAHWDLVVTMEDETGSVNIFVWKAVKEQFRDAVYRARLMAVNGVSQRDEATGGQVRHVIAKRVVDMTHLLGELATTSRDFH